MCAKMQEIADFNLQKFENWRRGRYMKNGMYSSYPSFLCLTNYLRCKAGETIEIHISEKDMIVTITQMDQNMKALQMEERRDGGECTMQEQAYCIGVSIYDPSNYKITYADYQQLLQNGFIISLTIRKDYSSDISSTDLSKEGLWRKGMYSVTGKYQNTESAICLYEYKSCRSDCMYTFRTNDTAGYQLMVREVNSAGKVTASFHLSNEDAFQTGSDTKKLAVAFYHPHDWNQNLDKYRKMFQDGLNLSLTDPESANKHRQEDMPLVTLVDSSLQMGKMTEWESGSYGEDGKFCTDTSSLRIYAYYKADADYYKCGCLNDTCRIRVCMYSKSYEYLHMVDVGNGDYWKRAEDAEYFTISLYQYLEGKKVIQSEESLSVLMKYSNDYDLKITPIESLTDLDQERAQAMCEIHKESLENPSNYREGWYYSWGGSYEKKEGSVCTRNLYKVEQKTYIININDSRVRISIQEYDRNGKWIRYQSALTNRSAWTPLANTAMVGITLTSTEWSTGISKLLGYGLIVDLSDCYYESDTRIQAIDEYDLSDYINWRSGEYSSTTGQYGINRYRLCTTSYLRLDKEHRERMVRLPSGYMTMLITEEDEDGKVILNTELQSGQKWTARTNCSYIGLTMNSSKQLQLSDYKNRFARGDKIALDVYKRYQHNTIMHELSAKQFRDTINVGWNVGNSLDSHYGDRGTGPMLGQERIWGNVTITRELIQYIAGLGFKLLRIPVTWYYNTYEDENGKLRVHKEWLERVQDVVDYALENNLYVMLNTHHEQPILYAGTEDSKMQVVLTRARELWQEIATYYQDYDEHLLFEAYNEIDNVARSWNFSLQAAEQMNQMNQVFVDTVRATGGNNSRRLLCVPTLLDGADTRFYDAFVLPKDTVKEKLLVQVHNYSTAFDQDIEPLFSQMETFATRVNAPIIIGEYGTRPSYLPQEYRVSATANYIARAAAHGIRCIYWDDGNHNNYGLVDRREYDNSDHPMLQALLQPKIANTPNKDVYQSMDSYVWMTLNQKTGALQEDRWWGTIVTDHLGEALSIPSGSRYLTVLLETADEAIQCRVHYVHFYNQTGELIKAYNSGQGYLSITYVIPDGATKLRIGINNSYSAIKKERYVEYLNQNKLRLTIGYL